MQKIVPEVERRIANFVSACKQLRALRQDERLVYFRKLSRNGQGIGPDYSLTMGFIYEKEFASRAREGDGRHEFVSALYQTRGLSSDSSFDANFPVYVALETLRGKSWAARSELRLDKVLIVGPGLDFAPRTGLNDSVQPQSLQPFAVADALLQLGISSTRRLRIDCVDVNRRVVEHLNRRTSRRLTIFAHPGTDEYERYFRDFGHAVGKSTGSSDTKTVELWRTLTGRVNAGQLNIVTDHSEGPPVYDLVIATNVLVYFNTEQLAMAFANVQRMLRGGGFFIHNDLRGEIETIGRALHMPIAEARMLRLREDERRAILHAYVIHRKR